MLTELLTIGIVCIVIGTINGVLVFTVFADRLLKIFPELDVEAAWLLALIWPISIPVAWIKKKIQEKSK